MANQQKTAFTAPSLGQVFRDTYYDGKFDNCTQRTVRVIEIHNDGVTAEQITNVRGETPKGKSRRTRISFTTLARGFEAVTVEPTP